MNFTLRIPLALLLLGTVSCGGPEAETQESYYEDVKASMEVDAATVDYTLALPQSYAEDVPAPLVLALHFGGRPSRDYGGRFMNLLVKPALGELEALILAPTVPDETSWTSSISESTVMGLLDEIRRQYNVDPGRILVTGFSLGAIGTWEYASKYPDVFSAAIPISGLPPAEAADALSSVPLYVIHSNADRVFDWRAVDEAVQRIRSRGADVEFHLVDGAGHFETRRFVGPLREAVPWIEERWESAMAR